MNEYNPAIDNSTGSQTVRHSKADALTDHEFELLLNESCQLSEIRSLETRFILLVCGRLGLRRGELTHMRESWVDWRKERITIPRHQHCDSGRDGGVCGHCRQLAKQQVEHGDALTLAEALEGRWQSKTEMAAREVPFGFSGRVAIVLERYFDEFDEWMYTGQSINRRINWVVDAVDEIDELHPHALRATAATFHAGRGLNTLSLQAMFGWADPSTAKNYIASSADNLDRELQFIHQ